jgi:uncharacterized protein YegP (UPF0339 family)
LQPRNSLIVKASRASSRASKGVKNGRPKLEIYGDKRSRLRWRAKSLANGKQVGKSTEGFSSKKNAENNASINGWKG